jgi:hypothetical protein
MPTNKDIKDLIAINGRKRFYFKQLKPGNIVQKTEEPRGKRSKK